ncbi:ATP-binding cassette domain-containing protein [Streptococcus sp. zg-86]|uniref:ATP-binding cassette domain-containing protein n=1 Tax=Streptococcus zhangguiae TaxID=2664091 RepID=A0A6I4RCD2_9STRE|nr:MULTISPECIES: ABC transporter ATP-binding protein [unclassified Streptococcus]MTB64431.1 ATP-binding cassette domain-containing protein [Streptococcus sp. zg-86]MTB90879.1 ATP-binding cassette domain-containing protein [Streptococcus sp. zg-36]MWV56418.1 ATP-binding cassette domain-containing protein [Streptococcus sp. zg-70]QTH47375.1 ATP-binding cassette domain-containing protein [Streptococcus sp. zg-86]
MKTIQEIFDKFSDIQASEKRDDFTLPFFEKEIIVKNVGFTYPDSVLPTLNDVNFTIKKGKKYALIGPSGSGKTTLLNILFGRLKSTQGEIYYDSYTYEELRTSLFQRIAYVEQNSVIFSGSIIENITLGKEYDENKIKNILSSVDLLDWVEQQAEGLMTLIDWEGNMLSGGQKQKIGIARALFLEKDIIFLDESLSAIDKVSVQNIEQCLLKKTDATVVLITHHLTPEIENLLDGIIEI